MKNTKLLVLDGARTETLRQCNLDSWTSLVRRTFPSGMRIALSVELPKMATKAELRACVHELNALHIPQKVIAFITGMSQSYVSKLLHS